MFQQADTGAIEKWARRKRGEVSARHFWSHQGFARICLSSLSPGSLDLRGRAFDSARHIQKVLSLLFGGRAFRPSEEILGESSALVITRLLRHGGRSLSV
jgi:hypothetical protein